MRDLSRMWLGPVVIATLVAVAVNAALSLLSVEHDAALIALLAGATVAAGVLALTALDSEVRPSWTIRRGDSAPGTGEDTRTILYRHIVEAHLTSRVADDEVVWRIADLARQRLRQLHGVRWEESPERATELLGPVLAEWVSHDRGHRYVPGARHQRYSVDQLADAVRRIEEL